MSRWAQGAAASGCSGQESQDDVNHDLVSVDVTVNLKLYCASDTMTIMMAVTLLGQSLPVAIAQKLT